MEDNKDTIKIEVKKSLIRSIILITYHIGFIGSIIGVIFNYYMADGLDHSNAGRGMIYAGYMIVYAIGIHLFTSLLYKEYTREDK